MKGLIIFLIFGCIQISTAQESKLGLSVFDGIVIVGYVDGGGFSNFTGPNINLTQGNSKYILGALPSLRYKNDTGTPKNAFVTPNLGVGFTYSYSIWAFQLPLYYNSKTATEDGKWHIGFGIGLRLNGFNKKD